MKYYGVGGKTNKWIENLLAGRSQRVVLDGEKSYNADVLSGVPQGSVLNLAYFYSTSMTCLKDSTKKQQSGYLLMIQCVPSSHQHSGCGKATRRSHQT